LVLPFWYWLTWVVPENACSSDSHLTGSQIGNNGVLEYHSLRETIGGASGAGGALFSTTKLGTDVGITPEQTYTDKQATAIVS